MNNSQRAQIRRSLFVASSFNELRALNETVVFWSFRVQRHVKDVVFRYLSRFLRENVFS